MTIDEAIKHCEEVAEANERTCKAKPNVNLEKYIECAAEHRQLAEWLKDYKRLLGQEHILDKVRAEIEQIEINGHIRDVECFRAGLNMAVNVIDKYKAESEVSDADSN